MTLSVLSHLFSCKKSTVDNTPIPTPAFSATGFWQGTLILGTTALFVNRADGTGCFYGLSGPYDTATAAIKFTYTYTVTGDFFVGKGADTTGSTINIISSKTALNYMTGAVLIANPAKDTRASYPFEVFRLP